MRVGIDATCWHNRRGYGRHARALLRALIQTDTENRYTLFLDSTEPAEPLPAECEVRVLESSVPTVQAASAAGRRSLADMWRMSRALSSPAFDLLFFPTIYSYVPVFGPARKLVTIHDVIAETYPELTVPRRAARLFWNAKVALGRLQADAVITVSDYSRDCIVRRFGTDPRRVFVVGEAADPVFRKLDRSATAGQFQSLGIDPAARTVVYVGGFSPHKNLEALVAAFSELAVKPDLRDIILVMVGDTSGDAFHSYYWTIANLVETLGLRNRVVFTGFMADEHLVKLLNVASVLVLPSFMEGFGLPAVEAAACGCPFIATSASPLEGLLGGGGIYIDPTQANITEALGRVLSSSDLRGRMGACGMAAASRLTWEQAARQMIDVIHKVSDV